MRVVVDALAKANQGYPSLNNCLEKGSPPQSLLWSVLVWNRLKPVAFCGDIIKRAFLQVLIREADGDEFRFHWISNIDSSQVENEFEVHSGFIGLRSRHFLLQGP